MKGLIIALLLATGASATTVGYHGSGHGSALLEPTGEEPVWIYMDASWGWMDVEGYGMFWCNTHCDQTVFEFPQLTAPFQFRYGLLDSAGHVGVSVYGAREIEAPEPSTWLMSAPALAWVIVRRLARMRRCNADSARCETWRMRHMSSLSGNPKRNLARMAGQRMPE